MMVILKHWLQQFFLRAQGFSLTELSVSMALIAVIASSALSVAITSDFQTKYSETNAKLDRLQEALHAFVALNRRLPCPADGTLTPSDSNFGLAGSPGCALLTNFSSGDLRAGVVPVRSLQLPDDFMYDGWGRRITYAVADIHLTDNITTQPDCKDPVQTGVECFMRGISSNGITIMDASASARETLAVYALISHGANGHGAFTKESGGSAPRINAYGGSNSYTFADELENAHLDASGNDTIYNATFVQKDTIRQKGGEYFDDIVRYATKEQILHDIGYIDFDWDCTYAQEAVEIPNNYSCTTLCEGNPCINADDETMCQSFAQEIYERCLQD